MSDSGRERIVFPLEYRRLWAVALLAGVTYGAVVALFVDGFAEWAVNRWPVGGPILLFHMIALPWVLAGIVVGRQPIRARRMPAAAGGAIVGVMLASWAVSQSKSAGFGAESSAIVFPLRMVLVLGVFWVAATLLLLLGRWLSRRLFGVPVPQTDPPRYCWVCAYECGDADPCPECGKTHMEGAARPQREADAWRMGLRGAMPLLALAATVFAGYSAWRVWNDYLPTRRFQNAHSTDSGWTPAYAYIDVVYGGNSQGAGGRYFNSIGRTKELGDGSGRMILVSYRALAPGKLPVMQVRLCAPATMPPGWPAGSQRMTDWGAGSIVADLNAEQAEQVIRNGVPRGLIDAIIAKASSAGWAPWGGMQAAGMRIEVDPAPYFTVESSKNSE